MSLSNPRISVLMPVYNVAPFLREAIDSVLAQTYTDFELIILNDCSPDDSENIIESYSDPRIVKYKGETNVGLANVLNVGIKMARGEFIARMDSDDINLNNRFQVQLDYLLAHPKTDLVSSGMQKFGTSSGIMIHKTSIEEVKFNALFYSPVLHSSSLWRRQRFIDNELYYSQDMFPSEDYDLWTRALMKGLILDNIPDILYKYRIHQRQVTSINKDWSTTSFVRQRYLQFVFPSVTESEISGILNYWMASASDKKELNNTFERLNGASHYFDSHWLHRYLKHYYQNCLFQEMKKNGIVPSALLELRVSHVLKLLCGKALK